MNPGRRLLTGAIQGYKRHLSPHKGYACAYRVHAGGCSCSTLGLRAISRYGAWRGLGVLRLRLRECRHVAESLRRPRALPRPAQAGFIDCDVPCDASCVDASCIDLSACSLGDACSSAGASEAWACCDWGGSCGESGGRAGSAGGASAPAASRPRPHRRRRGEPASAPPEPGPAEQPPA